ncbi:DUF1365 domain-containing protein [soil metagenome]
MTSSVATSRLYECTVGHQRLLPKGHQFKHGVFMLYLELHEISSLASRLRWFSHNSFNLFSYHDSDHLLGLERDTLADFLEARGICEPIGKAYLLTYPRVLGYVFNPVSFYFVYDQNNSPLACVAEVGNTFGEMKLYFMDAGELTNKPVFDAYFDKHFYVSPFGKLQDKFHFVLSLPGERLELAVDTVDAQEPEKKILLTTVRGAALELTDQHLLRLFWRYPLVTLRVITLIHWHALRLWLKRIPFFYKEQWPELQTNFSSKNITKG